MNPTQRRRSRSRYVFRLVAILVMMASATQLVIGMVVLWGGGAPGIFGGDFIAYYSAARQVWQEGWSRLYQVAVQEQFQQTLLPGSGLRLDILRLVPFNYPPPAVLLFLPFALLPARIAVVLWVVGNVLFALASVSLTMRASSPVAAHRWRPVLLALVFLPIDWGIVLGQPTGALLMFSTLGCLALARGDDRAAGCWLALVAAFKPQLVIAPALALLFARRTRAATSLLATGIGLGAFSLLSVGVGGIADYRHLLGQMDAFRGSSQFAVTLGGMVNVRSSLAQWTDMPDDVGIAVSLIGGATTVLWAAWHWAPRLNQSATFGHAYTAISAAGILGSYHSHYHDLVVLVAPALIWSERLWSLWFTIGDTGTDASPADVAPTLDGGGWRSAATALAVLLLVGIPGLAWCAIGIIAWSPGNAWPTMAVPGLALLALAPPVRLLHQSRDDAPMSNDKGQPSG